MWMLLIILTDKKWNQNAGLMLLLLIVLLDLDVMHNEI